MRFKLGYYLTCLRIPYYDLGRILWGASTGWSYEIFICSYWNYLIPV